MAVTKNPKDTAWDYYGDDPGDEITPANAAGVIAQELRFIRRTLFATAFDLNGETVGDGIRSALNDNLQTLPAKGPPESVAVLLARVAAALEDR